MYESRHGKNAQIEGRWVNLQQRKRNRNVKWENKREKGEGKKGERERKKKKKGGGVEFLKSLSREKQFFLNETETKRKK